MCEEKLAGTAQLRRPGGVGGGENGEQEGLHICKVRENAKEHFFTVVKCVCVSLRTDGPKLGILVVVGSSSHRAAPSSVCVCVCV